MMTADEQYAANMAFLVQHPTELLRQLPAQLAQVVSTNIQVVTTESGAVIGAAWEPSTQQWVGLCDAGDPAGQAERDVEAVYSPQIKVFTLLGMGMGYAAVALARRLRPYQRLSVWEVSSVAYKAMFSAVDVTPLFSDKRVQLFVGPDLVPHLEPYWLSLDVSEKLGIGMPLRSGYTAQSQAAVYDTLLEKTMDMLRHHMVGLSTWRQFGACIGDNDLENLPEYCVTPGYEHLAGLWKDRPAVCIAAGPSLQKNLRVLLNPDVRESVAVITAGTTFALLQGLHLAPDVVTTIDFQRLNWTDQFRSIPLDPACALVYLHSTYPQTVRRWPGPIFVAENDSNVTRWLRQFGSGKSQASQVQTVAHLNLLVALMMGARPICLLGQDLAMPLTQHHAAGARAQDQAPCEVPPEAFVSMADYRGQPIATRHSFLSMRTVFERIAAAHPDRQILNCTEGGLALAGIPNMPLTEALAPFRGQHGSGTLRGALRQVWQGYTPSISEALVPALTALRAQVEELLDVFCPAVARCQAERLLWDRDPEGDMPQYDGLGDKAVAAMVALEPTLGRLQAAFDLFVIRDFRIVETLGAVPTDERYITDQAVAQRCTCDRLAAVATVIAENGATVRRLLRVVSQRLDSVVAGPVAQGPETVYRWGVRQEYATLGRWLTSKQALNGIGVEERQRLRLWGQYLEHTQQYAAALAVYESWGLVPSHVARIKAHLAQYGADVRAAMPAYFDTHADAPLESATGEPVAGAYWGA